MRLPGTASKYISNIIKTQAILTALTNVSDSLCASVLRMLGFRPCFDRARDAARTSGSGKTKTAYQLAMKTGRAFYHADIGATISQWAGGTITKSRTRPQDSANQSSRL